MKHMGAKIFVNSITMTRVIGTFLIPILSIHMKPGILIFYLILLLLTDSIDGMMARRLHVCTLFGALLDALADKLFGIATLCVLAMDYPIMLLPIITETVITLINTNGASRGSSIESSVLGKVKTWVLGICIVLGFCTVYAPDIMHLFNNTTTLGIDFITLFSNVIDHQTLIMNSLSCICAGAGIMVAVDYRLRAKSDIKAAESNGLVAKNVKLKHGKDMVFALFDEDYYMQTLNEPLLHRLGEENKNERKNKRK